jgi:hypothetical protein
MLRFVGRWLSDSIRLGLGLVLALAAMQVPALTNAYTSALLQIAEEAQRDIARREEIVHQFYPALSAAGSHEALIESLRPLEPSNAAGLAASAERERVMRRTYERLMAASPLRRPIEAIADVLEDSRDNKRAVLQTALDNFVPQVAISSAAGLYGISGLVTGLLLAHLALSVLAALTVRRVAQRLA